jgi:pilus assembly protein CpaB
VLRRRWSRTSTLFAALAITFGAGAFVLVHGYTARLEALRPIVGTPVSVVVAGVDMSRGATLAADQLRQISLPSAFAPPGALRSIDDAAGRTLLADIASGEVVTGTRLAVKHAGPVAALVPPDLRAVVLSLPLPEGTLRAGDRVDVLATFGGGRPHTETVVAGVQVLSVLADSGQIVGSGADATRSVAVLVSPDDAERLAYAQAFADLSLAVEGAV